MSRYTRQIDYDRLLAWGFDRVTGYFLQVFGNLNNGEEYILVDASSMFGTSNGEMLELMEEYEIPEEHITKVALDLPF